VVGCFSRPPRTQEIARSNPIQRRESFLCFLLFSELLIKLRPSRRKVYVISMVLKIASIFELTVIKWSAKVKRVFSKTVSVKRKCEKVIAKIFRRDTFVEELPFFQISLSFEKILHTFCGRNQESEHGHAHLCLYRSKKSCVRFPN